MEEGIRNAFSLPFADRGLFDSAIRIDGTTYRKGKYGYVWPGLAVAFHSFPPPTYAQASLVGSRKANWPHSADMRDICFFPNVAFAGWSSSKRRFQCRVPIPYLFTHGRCTNITSSSKAVTSSHDALIQSRLLRSCWRSSTLCYGSRHSLPAATLIQCGTPPVWSGCPVANNCQLVELPLNAPVF